MNSGEKWLAPLHPLQYRHLIEAALREDLGDAGDITSAALIPADFVATASIVARAHGRVAGIEIALAVFAAVDGAIVTEIRRQDGADVTPGDVIATVRGPARSLLAAERVALNFLGRLSGIATVTRAAVHAAAPGAARGSGPAGSEAVEPDGWPGLVVPDRDSTDLPGQRAGDVVAPLRVQIADTRKTTPGLRALEKYAVRVGGGVNHRFGLYDAVLIKDNHVAVAGGVAEAIRRARKAAGHMVRIEVEVDSLGQLDEALEAGADAILLDNFSLDDLRRAVGKVTSAVIREAIRGEGVRRPTLEASGGITLDNIAAVAVTGVDIISLGRLTHSAPVLDVAMDLDRAAHGRLG